MNDNLRKQVKILKALNGVSYKRLAELIEIQTSSFYSWLRGQYDLSEYKTRLLAQFVAQLKER